jgi:hypothetical protein
MSLDTGIKDDGVAAKIPNLLAKKTLSWTAIMFSQLETPG